MKTTWKKLIRNNIDEKEGTSVNLITCTLTEEQLNQEFFAGYGSPQGAPFTAWTDARVYFPVCYDGAEWVESAPRNPCGEETNHVGG